MFFKADIVNQMSWTGEPLSECMRVHRSKRSSNFVPNITMGPPILTCVRDNVPDIFMDCHMMVADPAKVHYLSTASGLLR